VSYYVTNARLTSYGWVLVAIKLERFEHPKEACSFLKRVFFLNTTNGWIVAKCLWVRQQDSWNFWWARTKHNYKFLDPLLLGTLLTIKPIF
jgi:hypothetical protein